MLYHTIYKNKQINKQKLEMNHRLQSKISRRKPWLQVDWVL